jgi:hypothetical protein
MNDPLHLYNPARVCFWRTIWLMFTARGLDDPAQNFDFGKSICRPARVIDNPKGADDDRKPEFWDLDAPHTQFVVLDRPQRRPRDEETPLDRTEKHVTMRMAATEDSTSEWREVGPRSLSLGRYPEKQLGIRCNVGLPGVGRSDAFIRPELLGAELGAR